MGRRRSSFRSGLLATRSLLQALYQVGYVNLKCDCEVADVVKRWVPFSGFETPYVGSVDARYQGERLLGEAQGLTTVSNSVAELLLPRCNSLAGSGHPVI
jgi:hypothetical protein